MRLPPLPPLFLACRAARTAFSRRGAPAAARRQRLWHAGAAVLVALASWSHAGATAPGDRPADVVGQALRAVARLMRGRADGEARQLASRRAARAAPAGRRPSQWQQPRPLAPRAARSTTA